jgi:hypothetical protein
MRSRLGDDIDDFCVKCKRVMNHLVVSLLHDQPAKVRCRTCHGDHDFRHEQAPPPKIDARKAALIQQALAKNAASAADGVADAGAVLAETTVNTEAVTVLAAAPVTPLDSVEAVATPLSVSSPSRASARKNAKAK